MYPKILQKPAKSSIKDFGSKEQENPRQGDIRTFSDTYRLEAAGIFPFGQGKTPGAENPATIRTNKTTCQGDTREKQKNNFQAGIKEV